MCACVCLCSCAVLCCTVLCLWIKKSDPSLGTLSEESAYCRAPTLQQQEARATSRPQARNKERYSTRIAAAGSGAVVVCIAIGGLPALFPVKTLDTVRVHEPEVVMKS